MKTPKIAQKSPVVLDTKAGTYYFCSCGHSSKQPFCDGSHKDTGFLPEKIVVENDKKIAWCACKHSDKGAICDGKHRNL